MNIWILGADAHKNKLLGEILSQHLDAPLHIIRKPEMGEKSYSDRVMVGHDLIAEYIKSTDLKDIGRSGYLDDLPRGLDDLYIYLGCAYGELVRNIDLPHLGSRQEEAYKYWKLFHYGECDRGAQSLYLTEGYWCVGVNDHTLGQTSGNIFHIPKLDHPQAVRELGYIVDRIKAYTG